MVRSQPLRNHWGGARSLPAWGSVSPACRSGLERSTSWVCFRVSWRWRTSGTSAFWPAGDARAEQSACRWADAVFDALAPIACHVYLVERHPDTIRYQRELDLAFGPDLPRLRELKRQWDPDGLLPSLDASVLRS